MGKPAIEQCAIAGQCGGCSRISLPYVQQLTDKQAYIQELFENLAGPNCAIKSILGMYNPWHYRTKIVSPFAPSKKKTSNRNRLRTGRPGLVAARRNDILTGLYAAGTHNLVACEQCAVEHPVGRRVVAAVRQVMARYGVQPYNEDTNAGFMRHVVVRVGAHSGEVLVTLVTNAREFTGSRNFCKQLVKLVPEITTIVQNVNTRATNAILGTEEHTLYGPGFILDTLCGMSFRISSSSFYQTNAAQTEVLYRAAIELGGVAQTASTIVDAYCGTGTIGLVAAAAASGAQVIGIDTTESAIADARQNAQYNGIENARFIVQDAGDFMRAYAAMDNQVDIVFMDPPRSGASQDFLQALKQLVPERVVYISCNPETQARDCKVLVEAGYVLDAIQPVDMFPHTNHVENIVALARGRVHGMLHA